MTLSWETLITAASVVTAMAVLVKYFASIHGWLLRQNEQAEEQKSIKTEQQILTYGVLACLKGLKEQGCNGPVTEAIERIEEHLNRQAHQ